MMEKGCVPAEYKGKSLSQIDFNPNLEYANENNDEELDDGKLITISCIDYLRLDVSQINVNTLTTLRQKKCLVNLRMYENKSFVMNGR